MLALLSHLFRHIASVYEVLQRTHGANPTIHPSIGKPLLLSDRFAGVVGVSGLADCGVAQPGCSPRAPCEGAA